jgi:hypothetical protein
MSLIILLGDAITCPKIGHLKGPLISECMLIGETKAIPGQVLQRTLWRSDGFSAVTELRNLTRSLSDPLGVAEDRPSDCSGRRGRRLCAGITAEYESAHPLLLIATRFFGCGLVLAAVVKPTFIGCSFGLFALALARDITGVLHSRRLAWKSPKLFGL